MEEACHLQNCCISDVKHPNGDAELNRKRKLVQYELGNTGLLWPKHKIRDRCSNSSQGSSIIGCPEKENFSEETVDSDKINDEIEESDNDSISFLGASDNAIAFDVKGKAVDLPIQPSHVDRPSTSSNRSIGGVYSSSLYSVESRTISEASSKINKNTGESLQAGRGYTPFCEKYPTLGPDHESGIFKYRMEVDEVDNAADDDLMLYSNDVAPNSLVLSSGRWSPEEDARLVTRKPTIDQEFEQYFSMLML